MDYRKIKEDEINNAIKLVWKVFLEYEAPDYSKAGIEEFKSAINDTSWISAREFYGAFENEKLIGVIATKDKHHIALFFVDGNYHKQGIGKNLFKIVSDLNKDNYFTVNSSPYAHEVYKHLGFKDTDTEQCINGLRFIPMKMEYNICYSYAMGMSDDIYELEKDGFIIEKDNSDFRVIFNKKLASKWEEFVINHLEVEYWNEYISNNEITFIFNLKEGFKKYVVNNYNNDEVLNLCEELCNCKFGSIEKMIKDNEFYKEKLNRSEFNELYM